MEYSPHGGQERIIGCAKLSDIELDDSIKPTSAHNALTTIVKDGVEIKILRDNMPFGRPSLGEFGTYFIGYSRSPGTIEQMLENMFVGRPPGNCDRILAGAFVLTTRGGDFDLHIGQDVSIGYLSHTNTSVRLYLQETFTFLLLTEEAAVALAPTQKAKKV
jgi:deferrochelatase/peroxidase EfeB